VIHGYVNEVKHESAIATSAAPACRLHDAPASAPERCVPRMRLIALVGMIFAFGAVGPIAAKIRAQLPETAAAHPAIAATAIR
jgi:hypothetical protein